MNNESLKGITSAISEEVIQIVKSLKDSDQLNSKKIQEILPQLKNLAPHPGNYMKYAAAGLLGLIALGLFTSSKRINAG